jgi:tetratricopeptide (TPR) repeat protein
VVDNTRISELRRRVDSDPASIAFAQLAEEYRRSGQHEDAARICRSGLARHPTYLSARVTLGRSLIELGQYDEGERELSLVLQSAPENLAAIRGLAEIAQRRGNLQDALALCEKALEVSRHDRELEETIHDLTRRIAASEGRDIEDTSKPATIPLASLSPELEAAADEFTKALQALDALSLHLPASSPEPVDSPASAAESAATVPPREDAALDELEGWLDAIIKDRQARSART